MADEKKQERKPIKIGTHGRTTQSFRSARPKPAEYVEPKPTLRDKDPKEWKAKKLVQKRNKDQARASAKKQGHRMGSWDSGMASCKNAGCESLIRVNGPMEDEVGTARDATKTPCGGAR